jgi:MFS family permease
MNTAGQLVIPATASARAWLAMASVALGSFAMVTSEFLPIGLLGAIARDMGVAEGRAGLMVTVPGFTAAFAAPAATLLAGRLDRRTLLLVLSALILGSNLLVAGAHGFGMLLAGRVLLGLCVGGFWALAAAVGRRLVPEASGDHATAIVLAGISAGTVLGVPLATAIGNSLGWRGAFVVVAAGAAGGTPRDTVGPGLRRSAGLRAAVGVPRRARPGRDQRGADGHRVPAGLGGRRRRRRLAGRPRQAARRLCCRCAGGAVSDGAADPVQIPSRRIKR